MKLILSLLIPLAVGFVGSYFTRPELGGWYSALRKPTFNPPGEVFAPVWTVLYILMGIAMYLIWKAPVSTEQKRPAFVLYGIQLIFNFFWSFIFFRLHALGAALLWIFALWILILLTMLNFGRIRSLAAWLLVPYICWVTFATLLNFELWQLNP